MTMLSPRFWLLALLALVALAYWPVSAIAADAVPPDATRLVLPQTQLIAALVGSIVPALTYLLNHYAPWAGEGVKATVLALVSAAAGALTLLFDAGGIPLTWETVQVVGTAVVLAFLAHKGFWKPSGLSAKLGAGTNRPAKVSSGNWQDDRARPPQV